MTTDVTAEPEPSTPEIDVPLDEVMLAMDVVDTIRHQEALVQTELSEEDREQALIARIKGIYEAQGIVVPDEIIAKGVEALSQDRFTYEPPERTFGVRLAEVYVARGKWTKIGLVVLLLVAVVWFAIAYPRHRARVALVKAFTEGVDAVEAKVRGFAPQFRDVQGDLDRSKDGEGPAGVVNILDDARRSLGQARELVGGLLAGDGGLSAVDPEDYSDDRTRFDGLLEERRRGLARATELLGVARGHLQAVDRLRGMGSAMESTLAGLAGVDVEPDARQELETLKTQVRGALNTGDTDAARVSLGSLGFLVAELNRAYELRIVSRPKDRSGIWRHPDGQRDRKNFYIIVEAIGPGGRPITLPITSEEDQVTRRVSRFGVRVPERVYEAVKADKLDNGIVDKTQFGRKRRGARSPTYDFPVAGGMITRW